MLTRLVLILTLALQPLSLRTVPDSHPAGCPPKGCCAVVETTTCCGERVVDRVCHRTGGECTCASRPGVPERPAPAPQPRESNNRAAVLAPRPVGPAVVPTAAPRAGLAVRSRLETARSHNTAQAVIGVWLT